MGVGDVGAGGRVRLLEQVLDEDEGLRVLVLVQERLDEAEFEPSVVRGDGEGLAQLLFGLVVAGEAEEQLGEALPQRDVVRREADGFAEGLDGLFVHDEARGDGWVGGREKLSKPEPGRAVLTLTPSTPGKPSDARRLRVVKAEIARLIPSGQPFILIDDEKLRSELPKMPAIPFLENNGQYWGPPADDAIAISELERLRQAGAKYLVIVWSSFWWLDHYQGFHRYLQDKFDCVVRSEALMSFKL